MSLDSLLLIQIVFGMIYALIGAFVERFIMYGSINRLNNSNKFHAWTSKEAFGNLENYKRNVIAEKGSLIFYWYLYGLYKYGRLYVTLFLLVLVLVAVDDLKGWNEGGNLRGQCHCCPRLFRSSYQTQLRRHDTGIGWWFGKLNQGLWAKVLFCAVIAVQYLP